MTSSVHTSTTWNFSFLTSSTDPNTHSQSNAITTSFATTEWVTKPPPEPTDETKISETEMNGTTETMSDTSEPTTETRTETREPTTETYTTETRNAGESTTETTTSVTTTDCKLNLL